MRPDLTQRIAGALCEWDWTLRCYVLASILILFLAFFPLREDTQNLCLGIAALGFGAGFCLWAYPIVRELPDRRPGKLALVIIHALLLLVSLAIARYFVAVATGLPPQDLDLTVGFVAFACYLPVMGIALTIAVGIAAIFFQLRFIATTVLRKSWRLAAMHFGHMCGALAVCLIVSKTVDILFRQYYFLHPAIRWIAYYSDYHELPAYPGMGSGKRVRLHGNGVVSTATKVDSRVTITVSRIY